MGRARESVNTLFCQHVVGCTGRDVTRRGPDVAAQAAWSLADLQELLDEWVIAGFTDRCIVSTCPDLRLLMDYMSVTESAEMLPHLFGVSQKYPAHLIMDWRPGNLRSA